MFAQNFAVWGPRRHPTGSRASGRWPSWSRTWSSWPPASGRPASPGSCARWPGRPNLAGLLLGDDLVAEVEALVAGVDAGAGDQLGAPALGPAAERAAEQVPVDPVTSSLMAAGERAAGPADLDHPAALGPVALGDQLLVLEPAPHRDVDLGAGGGGPQLNGGDHLDP